MPEPKRPLKVFLCHAHADRDSVRALYIRLTKDGVDAWLDKEKLLPGQDWELEIRKAVREADVVVVCLSKQFNQAGFRQKEVRLALDTAMEKPEGEIFIIPARLEECETLESLRKWHWVDLFENVGYEMLMRALRTRANKIGATLQIKKGWLPKITSPLSKPAKPVEENNSEKLEKKGVEAKNDIPDETSLDKFSDGWDDEWKKGFESASNAENKLKKQKEFPVETSKPKGSLPKKTKSLRKPNTVIVVAIIGAVATIIAGLLSSPLIERLFSPAPVVTDAATATFTLTSRPLVPSQTLEPAQVIETPTITITPTESSTPTVTPLPVEITDTKGVSMALVPAGEFTMGNRSEDAFANCQKYSDNCFLEAFNDVQPPHLVYLDAFYMDYYEVTNSLYKLCVIEGGCTLPKDTSSHTHPSYYNNLKYDNFPVIYVDWNQAQTYCEWRGGSLPTEAQWEKAARGTNGFTFPWGDELSCKEANYYGCQGDTKEVGSYESGKSPYGIYDMAGNVWEWVEDWYDTSYYAKSPYINPSGPSSGENRVLRGGSWSDSDYYRRIQSTSRALNAPDRFYDAIGFRCAHSLP